MRVAQCRSCGTVAYPAHRVCRSCRGRTFGETEARIGTVVTHTLLHVPPPGFEPPVRLAIVEFEGGGRALGRLTAETRLGARVEVEEADPGETEGGTRAWRFRPVPGSGARKA